MLDAELLELEVAELDAVLELVEVVAAAGTVVVAAGAGVEAAGAVVVAWLELLELLSWLELEVVAPPTGILAETVVLVVTVLVVTVPGTHFPPARTNPSLLEQVLQATPPSL